jgi:hypothetical protein
VRESTPGSGRSVRTNGRSCPAPDPAVPAPIPHEIVDVLMRPAPYLVDKHHRGKSTARSCARCAPSPASSARSAAAPFMPPCPAPRGLLTGEVPPAPPYPVQDDHPVVPTGIGRRHQPGGVSRLALVRPRCLRGGSPLVAVARPRLRSGLFVPAAGVAAVPANVQSWIKKREGSHLRRSWSLPAL